MTHPLDDPALDGLGLADLVRRRETTPEELLDGALERIRRLNPRLNAVVRVTEEEARRSIAAGLPDGPFRGVPFLLKDLVAERGYDIPGEDVAASIIRDAIVVAAPARQH